MSAAQGSYRQLLRASFVVGGATVLTILIGLVRGKAVALLLGPAGLGLIALYQSLIGFGTSVAGMGLRTAGTRQMAEAMGQDDAAQVASVRRALLWATIVLAWLGAATFWLARDQLALRLLGDPARARDVGLLGIGVALGVVGGSQTALLTGLRRIGDTTRIGVWSALLSAVAGCAVLALFGESGVIAFVLAAPLFTFLLGYARIRRLDLPRPMALPLPQLAGQWRALAALGLPFMLTAMAQSGSEFFVRAVIQDRLGPAALGQFFAAWTISSTYVALVLSGVGVDYYPRLTAIIADPVAARQLVNQQIEVIMLLAAPVLLAVIGLAPFVLALLYSRAFGEAASVLRWQALGDVAMVVIWPLDYLLLARGRGLAYFTVSIVPLLVFMAMTVLLLPHFGIEASGIAFAAMTAVHLALGLTLGRISAGWTAWTRATALHFAALLAVTLGVFLAARQSDLLGAIAGTALALLAALYALRRFAAMTGSGADSRIGRLAAAARRLLGSRR